MINENCLVPEADIDKNALYVGMKRKRKEFVEEFLKQDERTFESTTKHKLCDFLREYGSCMLGECKPESYNSVPNNMIG